MITDKPTQNNANNLEPDKLHNASQHNYGTIVRGKEVLSAMNNRPELAGDNIVLNTLRSRIHQILEHGATCTD